MGYMKIPNLYKDQTVLMFNKVWVTEKIHGTSAWVSYRDDQLFLHPGGVKLENFEALFDLEPLLLKLQEIFGDKQVKIHGEHYGGKIQRMKATYGENNKFIVFEIKVGETFLSFDRVKYLCEQLGLEAVHGEIVDCDISVLNKHRDLPSVQAKRNGIEEDMPREGIVIRPLAELTMNNGGRVIAKHKADSFKETKTPREVSPEQLQVLKDAEAIADEWVTAGRLDHVMDAVRVETQDELDMQYMGTIIKTMIADIRVEGKDEIEMTSQARKQIGKKTAGLFKEHLQKQLEES